MQIRDIINRHPVLAIVVTSILLLAAGGFLASRVWSTLNPPPAPEPITMAYFYDQNTGKLFAAPASTVGPIETESGPYHSEPAGVRAHVFACGQCSIESNRFIGYLSKPLPPEEQPKDEPPLELIKRVEDEQWYRSDQPEARQIMAELGERCPSSVRRNYCRPEPQI